jgi:hypothetical protein
MNPAMQGSGEPADTKIGGRTHSAKLFVRKGLEGREATAIRLDEPGFAGVCPVMSP